MKQKVCADRSIGGIIAKTIAFMLIMLYAVSLIFPLLWILSNSFRSQSEFISAIWALPDFFNTPIEKLFVNYIEVFSGFSIINMFLRSIYLTFFGSIAGVLSASLAAYVLARYQFPCRNLIYFLAITVMLIPTTGSMVATYKFFETFNLIDTYLAPVILYSGPFGTSFILLYGFFKEIPEDFREAAVIDGANEWRIFVNIMIPLISGGLATVWLLNVINIWNDYLTVYLYMPLRPSLAVGLQLLISDSTYEANYPKVFSLMIVSTIPVLIVYSFFSDTIIENMTMGGIKG